MQTKVKRAEARGFGELENIVENPIDAYNASRVGLPVSSLAELATYAHIRRILASVPTEVQSDMAHSRLSMPEWPFFFVWPPGALTLDLLPGSVLQTRRDRHRHLGGDQVEPRPGLRDPRLREERARTFGEHGRGRKRTTDGRAATELVLRGVPE